TSPKFSASTGTSRKPARPPNRPPNRGFTYSDRQAPVAWAAVPDARAPERLIIERKEKEPRPKNRGSFSFLKVSGVEEGGGEPSSGSTPDKKSSDTCPAPEPSSAHLGLPDRHGQESIDRHILPAFTTIASLVL